MRSIILWYFPLRYIQSNGYKPIPLDLNHVKLTPNQNTLVERLAENGHNVWARDRVRQGWTYSIVQVTTGRGCWASEFVLMCETWLWTSVIFVNEKYDEKCLSTNFFA